MNGKIKFSWREWVMLAVALALTVLYMHVFGFGRMLDSQFVPGVGATVFALAALGAGALYLGRGARYDAVTLLLLAASVLLALSFAVFSNMFLCTINYFACAMTGCLALARMAGRDRYTMGSWKVLPNTIGLVCKALFVNVDKPFRALGSLSGDGRRRTLGVLIGIAAAIPLLVIVIVLLCSADAVFGGIFKGIGKWLESLNAPRAIWYAVRCISFTLFIFSAFYFLAWPRGKKGRAAERQHEGTWSVPFLVVFILLDLVYAVFVAIQVAFLFGGMKAAAMQGGYAEYARTGFFQLVAVAFINMAAVLVSATFMKHDACRSAAKWAAMLLTLFTAVILASAVYRMILYISVYGLSLLRVLTLWGMAMIAIGLALSAVKLWRADVKFFPVFFAVCIASWIAFNYSNPAGLIADYNADLYLSGRAETVDVVYLRDLGPEAMKSLRRISKESDVSFVRSEAARAAYDIVSAVDEMDWCEWRLVYSGAK